MHHKNDDPRFHVSAPTIVGTRRVFVRDVDGGAQTRALAHGSVRLDGTRDEEWFIFQSAVDGVDFGAPFGVLDLVPYGDHLPSPEAVPSDEVLALVPIPGADLPPGAFRHQVGGVLRNTPGAAFWYGKTSVTVENGPFFPLFENRNGNGETRGFHRVLSDGRTTAHVYADYPSTLVAPAGRVLEGHVWQAWNDFSDTEDKPWEMFENPDPFFVGTTVQEWFVSATLALETVNFWAAMTSRFFDRAAFEQLWQLGRAER